MLDMEDVLLDPDTCGEVDGFVGDVSGFGHGPIRGRSIGAKDGFGRQKLQEQAAQRVFVGLGKHGIEMFALPILHHEDRNLLVGQSAFLGVPSAMARGARQVALSLERLKEVRFVRFDQGRRVESSLPFSSAGCWSIR